MAKYRLAIVISHPVQYQSPLFRKLAAHPDIDLTVYYGTNYGATEQLDPGFGVRVRWDVPLLEGYNSVFLGNYSPVPHVPSSFLWVLNPGIISALLKNRYDAVMVHGYNLATSILAYIGAWLSGTPVLFRGETVLRPNRPWWVRVVKRVFLKTLFWRTSACLTIGSRSEEFYLHYGVPREKLFFTPYSVDNDFFRESNIRARRTRKALKARLGFADNAKLILFAGKLIKKKRPLDLLRAYDEFLREEGRANRRVGLVFVGDGILRNDLERYARERNLHGVRFVGFVNQSKLPSYFAIADLFVLPSGPGEVSPLIINETMASGLPIIVSDAVPSARDFVEDSKNGYLFQAGDIGRLSGLLRRLVNDSARLRAMGKCSQKKISTWNYDACVDGFYRAIKFVAHKNEKHE